MKKSSELAMCSIITAFSVILLFLGGVTVVLAYVAPMICGIFMIMLKTTFSKKCAWITYTATTLLSFILITDKECMLMYVFFFGFYPIIKESLDKIKAKPVRIILKFLLFNATMVIVQLLCIYVFGIPLLDEGEGKIFILVFAIMLNILFVVYDLLLEKLFVIYYKKIERRVKKLFH